MQFIAHLSYPYIVANGIAIALGKTIPPEYNLLIIIFSLFPDVDTAYDFFKQLIKTKKYTIPKTHHENFTHWPIVYVPLIAIAIITLNPFFIIAASAIYIHLLMDSFFCNQGVMWLYPFSNKWTNYFSAKTKKKWGSSWNKAYYNLAISSVDKFAFFIVLVHVTYLIV